MNPGRTPGVSQARTLGLGCLPSYLAGAARTASWHPFRRTVPLRSGSGAVDTPGLILRFQPKLVATLSTAVSRATVRVSVY